MDRSTDSPGGGVARPPATGVAEHVRHRLQDMSPAERRVARALLAGPPTIGLESSARLAEHAGVSGPTVSRFVARLGFDNYAAFQRALHDDITAQVLSPVEVYRRHRAEDRAAGSSVSLPEAGAELGRAVAASLSRVDAADFARAVELLSDSRRQVLAAGGWFSHLLAGYLSALLREIRPRVRAVPPVASERASAIADVGKRDIVVVFDFRRYEQDTFDFATAARARGARIVLFTDPWLSPVAEIAEAVLPAQVIGPTPFESLTPTVALLEVLVTAASETLGPSANRRFAQFGTITDHWMRPWVGGPARG
ncbi:MAG: MurR/RpiR family transcriptional regulator [Mycobacteriales bacterium]